MKPRTHHRKVAKLSRIAAVTLAAGLSCACISQAVAQAVAQSASQNGGAKAAADTSPPGWGLLDKYCEGCHNSTDWAGGVAFDTMTSDSVPQDAKVWEEAVKKLSSHLMPPPGKPQPDQAQIDTFSHYLTSTIDASPLLPRAGHVPLERLTRKEFANQVRTLLNVDIKAEDLLPPENEVGGFENIAAALSTSPAFLEEYVSAARKVAGLAVGTATPKISSNSYQATASQISYVAGFPPGTRGGLVFRQNFPVDGEYHLTITDLGIGLYDQASELRTTLVVLVDRKVVLQKDVGGQDDQRLADRKGIPGVNEIMQRFTNMPINVTAGTHEVILTFRERSRSLSDEYIQTGAPQGNENPGFGQVGGDRLRQVVIADAVQVSGPYGKTSLSQTPSRKRIFTCYPKSEAEEGACASEIATNLATQAYRRPATARDLTYLMPLYAQGRKEGGSFDAGITELVAAILVSPDFLYRSLDDTKPVVSQVSSANSGKTLPLNGAGSAASSMVKVALMTTTASMPLSPVATTTASSPQPVSTTAPEAFTGVATTRTGSGSPAGSSGTVSSGAKSDGILDKAHSSATDGSSSGSKADATLSQGAKDAQPAFHKLNDLELASRLSFFLWGQGPDDTLLKLATANTLSDPKTLDAQVSRMLKDPKAQNLVTDMAFKWLSLDKLSSVEPDPKIFPGFSPDMRSDITQEITLFLKDILLGDHPVTDLLTANYTYLNDRLARHYGIPGIYGPQFRKVELTDSHRFGLLGKAAVLMRTSYGDRTSPVLRGAWILERIEGTPPTPPPPNVNTDLSVKPGEKPTSVRARLEMHRANPTCNQCHGVIDPLGLSLENFDVTGQWRDLDTDSHTPIDAKTVLPGGMPANGPDDLRKSLDRNPDQLVSTLTQKLMAYGINRQIEYQDMRQVRAIVSNAKKDNYTLTSLIKGIVNSDAFRYQADANGPSEKVKPPEVTTVKNLTEVGAVLTANAPAASTAFSPAPAPQAPAPEPVIEHLSATAQPKHADTSASRDAGTTG